MSVELAGKCRDDHLQLTEEEKSERLNFLDEYDPKKPCMHHVHIGLFFDGTNNNKYRDLPIHCASNVARLFEAFTGSPAKQEATYGGKPSVPLLVGIPDNVKPYYRKIYIPGLGTAMPEADDPGENLGFIKSYGTFLGDKTRGLAMALHGEGRIRWALLQTLNQVALALNGNQISDDDIKKAATSKNRNEFREAFSFLFANTGPLGQLTVPDSAQSVFMDRLKTHNKNLAKSLEKNFAQVCGPNGQGARIHLSVFGFSRGAAEARAYVNRLYKAVGCTLGGLRYTVKFMGLFDTVASVGIANLVPTSQGHMAWADGQALAIPTSDVVKQCVHLVSAHEVRRCFPLDSVGLANGSVPSNCEEYVYPGVHSDVGGGYTPHDQGRCKDDTDKISQISLAQMYRKALIAGVPLAAENLMPGDVKARFNISDDVKKRFNAYIAYTQPKGKSAPDWNKHKLRELMCEQYYYYLSWRKYRHVPEDSTNPLPIHKLPGLVNSPAVSAKQDIYDIWVTDQEIDRELAGRNALLTQYQIAWSHCTKYWRSAPALDTVKDAALIDMFDLYVHDSRAWFKLNGEADDEWYGGGKDPKGNTRPSKRDKHRVELEAKEKRLDQYVHETNELPGNGSGNYYLIKRELELNEKWGTTL